ncbi:MAG: RagB/SusD family nutrient uptake outer membrane protein [Pedobacter sp.]|nr:MAG: RagB/SusD family nutrient uptake outer membrane protein [Pedobacter sp.]
MKKLRYILIILFISTIATISGCKKDFLERTPGVALSEEAVFADPVLSAQFADKAYTFLVDDYARFDSHRGASSQASDEAVSGTTTGAIRYLNQGLFHDHSDRVASINDIRDIWSRAYAGIRQTNVMLNKMPIVPWTPVQSPQRIEGEMHFIRAFLYFELTKRFGGVPILDRAYEVNENLDIPRNTYQECTDFILADLDKAEAQLPEDYDNANYGRATIGAAKALKARVLLYAASALNNESNDLAKWTSAAAAAKSLMDMGKYSLQNTYSDILNVAESPEYIMMKIRAPRLNSDNKIVEFSQSPGSGSISGSMNPTQNHVDLYEMKNGKAITDPTSGYNPQAPYANRDPRLTFNVLVNDQAWQGRRLEMWYTETTNASGQRVITYSRDWNATNPIYTATRYYCRKYWPEPYIRNVTGTALLNFLYFRYAEVLLNYAEAQNEAVGPDASVYAAINQIRSRGRGVTGIAASERVDMPDLPAGLSQAQMRDRIRNERAVELAFEDHRWYDIMRWKAGPQIVAQPVYGMNILKNANGSFTFNRVLLPSTYQKVFLDHMHRYPIPRTEINKSNNILIQNPGW